MSRRTVGRPPTIVDVAAEAEVSISTVSRVMRGGQDVSDATRLRVESVVRRLGYRPSSIARALVSGESRVLALLVSDLCIMRPHPETKELQVTSVHPGVSREQVVEQTGWPVAFADAVAETPAPTGRELEVLRDLQARTAAAHGVAPAE